MFFGSLAVAWLLIVRLPADFFCHDRSALQQLGARHPLLRALVLVVKNLLGLMLLASGLVMLFTPGQGIICILLGLGMMDLPGKRKLIRHVLSRPGVLKTLNRVRQRANRPPLMLR